LTAQLSSTPGATSHLGKDLKRSLSGAIIGQEELCLREDNTHQSDVRKIETLAYHLSPDQDVRLVR
jgi:hypothetical protein